MNTPPDTQTLAALRAKIALKYRSSDPRLKYERPINAPLVRYRLQEWCERQPDGIRRQAVLRLLARPRRQNGDLDADR